jgi:hypothetical protein
MELGAVVRQVRKRWWLVVAMAALAAAGAALAVASRADRHARTVHFVLHPDGTFNKGDVPSAVEVLRADGPLAQTVLGVLSSDEILRRAARAARLQTESGYTLESTLRPGSTIIDSAIGGPSASGVARLSATLGFVASDYVNANYSGYSLDRLGVDPGGGGTGASGAEIIVLALLLGGALGVGLVLADSRLRAWRTRPAPVPAPSPIPRRSVSAPVRSPSVSAPRRSPVASDRKPRTPRPERKAGPPVPAPKPAGTAPERKPARAAADQAARQCQALTSRGTPCRHRAVDERGYCRVHLARAENGGAVRVEEDGTAVVERVAGSVRPEPDHHAWRDDGTPDGQARGDDEG